MSRAAFLARTQRRAEAAPRLLVAIFTVLTAIALGLAAAHWIATK